MSVFSGISLADGNIYASCDLFWIVSHLVFVLLFVGVGVWLVGVLLYFFVFTLFLLRFVCVFLFVISVSFDYLWRVFSILAGVVLRGCVFFCCVLVF